MRRKGLAKCRVTLEDIANILRRREDGKWPFIQWEIFRILNGGTLVPYSVILWRYIPLHSPYTGITGLIHGRYLQFRFLKWPLICTILYNDDLPIEVGQFNIQHIAKKGGNPKSTRGLAYFWHIKMCSVQNLCCLMINVNPGLTNPGWLIVVVPPNNSNRLVKLYFSKETAVWIYENPGLTL